MEFLSKYNYPYSVLGLSERLEEIISLSNDNYNAVTLKKIFSLIDLTSLNSTDTKAKIEGMCTKVNELQHNFPSFPNVAAICVYPNFVSTVKSSLNNKAVGIASVSAGFPASQTFLEIKTSESAMAVADGATDIDIVISIGKFLSGKYQEVYDEISAIKKASRGAHLKVILETGALTDPLKIWEASIIAMHAGADFIKTSTGKMQPAATIEAALVMVEAIKMFHEHTKKKVGLKPAGGISTGQDAVIYYTIVEKILGAEWINSKLFRIGASSLANNLISEVMKMESEKETEISYF